MKVALLSSTLDTAMRHQEYISSLPFSHLPVRRFQKNTESFGPMGYELASSSAEEGEISDTAFPYYKSHLQYYYYPHTTKFIGRNTVPHFINYKSDLYCTRLKKDIRQDYSYIPFNLLENSKTFFDNKFVFVKELGKTAHEQPRIEIPHLFTGEDGGETLSGDFVLRDIKTDYKEISTFDRKSVCESRYDKFYKQLFFARDDRSPLVKSIQGYRARKVIVIEDRVLEALDSKYAYLFCRVIEEKVLPEGEDARPVRKTIFEDVFYSKAYFYEYLGLYAEHLIKSFNSEEVRVYENKSTLLLVHSGTTFLKDSAVRRLYSGVDVKKNAMLVCNREGPAITDVSGSTNENAGYLDGLDLPEGDYVINDKKLYRIDNGGASVEFGDVDFGDFIKTKWEQ